MILRAEDMIESGAYSDIFRPLGDTLAYKLFISGQHPTNVSQNLTRPQDDERRHKTYLSECEAYERAAQRPFLRNHIPRSFRRCVIENVIGSGTSVAHLYMLDHCYAIQYIEGHARKLGESPDGFCPLHIEKALQKFYDVGVHHLIDTSIFFPDDPNNFIFIDFATEEHQAFWDP